MLVPGPACTTSDLPYAERDFTKSPQSVTVGQRDEKFY